MSTPKLEGLPVSGYRPQSQDSVALVNANKQAEERVLRILDELAAHADVDKRWLAIGRTQIEQGFMAINRAVFKPARIDVANRVEESGWLLEKSDSPTSAPLYFSTDGVGGQPTFSPDHLKALRFARREDAEGFARCYGDIDAVRICEHAWS